MSKRDRLILSDTGERFNDRTDYCAMYLPASEGGNPSVSGFDSEEDAWNWIFDNGMCKGCREERRRWLMGMAQPESGTGADWTPGDSEFPACSYEWDVVKASELKDDELPPHWQEV